MATKAAIRSQVLRAVDAIVFNGTVDSATGTTLVDSFLTYATTDDLVGMQVVITAGTGIGQIRLITASAPASDNITVAPAWVTNPDTTSTYDIIDTRKCSVEMANNAIDSAIRYKRYSQLVDVVDSRLVTNDILQGRGSFQQPFANGIATNWTKSTNGTATRQTTSIYQITPEDVASQRMASDGTNEGYLQYAVPDFAIWAGKVLILEGWVYSNVSNRVRLRLLDGQTTQQTAEVTTGTKWTKLSSSLTVGTAPTQLYVQCYVSSGAAVNADFQHIRLLSPDPIYDYLIPGDTTSNFAYIHRVDVETGTSGVFKTLSPYLWKVQHGGTPRLQIYRTVQGTIPGQDSDISNAASVPDNRKLRLFGQELPIIPTADSDDVESLDEFAIIYSVWYLHQIILPDPLYIELHAAKTASWERAWRQLDHASPRHSNSRLIYRQD